MERGGSALVQGRARGYVAGAAIDTEDDAGLCALWHSSSTSGVSHPTCLCIFLCPSASLHSCRAPEESSPATNRRGTGSTSNDVLLLLMAQCLSPIFCCLMHLHGPFTYTAAAVLLSGAWQYTLS
jgi:hypothetical protein